MQFLLFVSILLFHHFLCINFFLYFFFFLKNFLRECVIFLFLFFLSIGISKNDIYFLYFFSINLHTRSALFFLQEGQTKIALLKFSIKKNLVNPHFSNFTRRKKKRETLFDNIRLVL